MKKNCRVCGLAVLRKKNESCAYFARKKFCSHACYWQSIRGTAPKHLAGMITYGFRGKHHTKESRELISKRKLGSTPHNKGKRSEYRGPKHHNWRGGVALRKRKQYALMQSAAWKEWRISVFERDGYRCKMCGNGGYVEPHHILPKALFEGRIFDITNGITLCRKCHDKTRGKEMQYVQLCRTLLGL